jgi:peptidoglycan/LPS O-acetylase OafA/YrhL
VVVTVIAARALLAPVALKPLGLDALAAGGFVINVVFARRLGDYFGSQLGQTNPSPLLHYWSLAVEEQFYLVWPLLIVLLTRRPRHLRRLLATVMVVIAALSLLSSVWLTDHHPTWAFYLLPARMCELLAGALLALAGRSYDHVPGKWRAVSGWIGIVGIAVAVLSYDETTAFPGTATMLPVLCTVLVIIGGGRGAVAWSPAGVLSARPLQWIGRHSYAIYLWHWPVLVLADAQWGPLSLLGRLVAIAVSVGLAAVSLRLVENPVRHSPRLAAAPARGLALGAGLCAVVLLTGAASVATTPRLDGGQQAAAPSLVAIAAPTGSGAEAPDSSTVDGGSTGDSTAAAPAPAVSIDPNDLPGLIAANRAVLDQGLAATAVPSNLRPSLTKVYDDRPDVYGDGCVAIGVDDQLKPCRYGAKGAATKVVLYGDSHAAQWFPALESMATAHGFELIVLTKGGCPTADVPIPTNTLARTCPIWRDKAVAFIAQTHPAMVVVTSSSHYPNSDAEWAAGFETTIARIAPSTQRLVVLGDNPASHTEPAACLSRNLHSVQACTTSRGRAISTRLDGERAAAASHHATFVDPTDWFCTDAACPTIIGNIMMFRDINHITTVAANWYAPLLSAALVPVLEGSPSG